MVNVKDCQKYNNGFCLLNHCFCSEARRTGFRCELNAKPVYKKCGHYQNEVCDCNV